MTGLLVFGVLGKYLVFAALVPQVDVLRPYHLRGISQNRSLGGYYHWGKMYNGDRLLYQTRAIHSFQVISNYCRRQSSPSVRYNFYGKASLELDLPPQGTQSIGTIYYIEAIDMSRSRSGGYVCITQGGIGRRYVSFLLESNFNCSIDFLIRIYGK